jgi:hypothetical protein
MSERNDEMVMMMREAEMTGVKGNRNDENASPLEGEGNACGASEGEGAGAVKLQPKRDSTLARVSVMVKHVLVSSFGYP